jgi:hypothetical protein
LIAQSVQPRPAQRSATVAVIAEDIGIQKLFSLRQNVSAQLLDLSVNGLGLCLAQGRDPYINGYWHGPPLLEQA